MTLREWLKQFVPMSSRSLNNRLDIIFYEIKDLEQHVSAMENRMKGLTYNHLDPELYAHAIKQWYQDVTGNPLDLKNPKTYNEKIQWMKVYDRDPLKTKLADKYLVRDWVKEKLGGGRLFDPAPGRLPLRRRDRLRRTAKFLRSQSQPRQRHELYRPE